MHDSEGLHIAQVVSTWFQACAIAGRAAMHDSEGLPISTGGSTWFQACSRVFNSLLACFFRCQPSLTPFKQP